MKTLEYLISLSLIVLMTSALNAQQVTISTDSAKIDFRPTAVRIGTDVLSIVQNFTKDDFTEFNVSVDVDLYRYFFNIEYGQLEQGFMSDRDNAMYTVDGSYWRFGPEINFLKKDPEQNALFFGFRYAFSNFSDELDFNIDNGFFGSADQRLENDNLRASWFEMVSGLKVKIWKNIWFGYTARFKFGVTGFEENELIPHLIPGFGRAEETVAWDFNYWIAYRIPIGKEKKPLIKITK
ncbi:MAG: DUF6048 family protein [Bacteroidota bacterium]